MMGLVLRVMHEQQMCQADELQVQVSREIAEQAGWTSSSALGRVTTRIVSTRREQELHRLRGHLNGTTSWRSIWLRSYCSPTWWRAESVWARKLGFPLIKR